MGGDRAENGNPSSGDVLARWKRRDRRGLLGRVETVSRSGLACRYSGRIPRAHRGVHAAHLPIWYLWPFLAGVAFIGGITVYISARQFQTLRTFLRHELEASG